MYLCAHHNLCFSAMKKLGSPMTGFWHVWHCMHRQWQMKSSNRNSSGGEPSGNSVCNEVVKRNLKTISFNIQVISLKWFQPCFEYRKRRITKWGATETCSNTPHSPNGVFQVLLNPHLAALCRINPKGVSRSVTIPGPGPWHTIPWRIFVPYWMPSRALC